MLITSFFKVFGAIFIHNHPLQFAKSQFNPPTPMMCHLSSCHSHKTITGLFFIGQFHLGYKERINKIIIIIMLVEPRIEIKREKREDLILWEIDSLAFSCFFWRHILSGSTIKLALSGGCRIQLRRWWFVTQSFVFLSGFIR